jgi:peptide/nickel transport system substrate-binding protein
MTRRTPRVLAVTAVLAGVLAAQSASSGPGRDGGIFRITFQSGPTAFDHVDPALAYSRESWTLLDTVCAQLMRYADKAPPAGYKLVPEVAAAAPKVSADGRIWTFTLRRGFRFSDGTPVRADAFAQAIHRTLAPGVDSPAYLYTQAIDGAADVRAGKAQRASGVVATAHTLTVRFTREVRGFDAWTTMPFFCAVPPTLPPSAEGVRSFPAAGPYVVRDYRPGSRVTLRRNRHYGGDRTHHVDGFDVDLTTDTHDEILDRVETGKADWGYVLTQEHFDPSRALLAKYGQNRSRFFVKPGLGIATLVLNSSRPLFKDNPELRRAVNLALDRFGFVGPAVDRLTDQLLTPRVAGFQDRDIYPFEADVARAKALAEGNLRGARLVLYVPDCPGAQACAQILARQFQAIGLEVEIKTLPGHSSPSAYLGRLGNPNELWDAALIIWTPDFVDPFGYINRLLGARNGGGTDLAGFDEGAYQERMSAAARLQGTARAQAYRELDLDLSRDAAPLVPLYVMKEATLVSARAGCILLRPALILTTVCLKR